MECFPGSHGQHGGHHCRMMMSSVIDSGDLDRPSETDKVENVGEESVCSEDPTADLQKGVEDSSAIDSVEQSGVDHQDEALTVGQQSAVVEKQAFDQIGARDVDGSRSSHVEDKSNDCEIEQDPPMQDQEFAEVADQNLHQNVGDIDSRSANCEDKSNDRELERNTPMESEDNYSGELYDCLIFVLFEIVFPNQSSIRRPHPTPTPPPPQK